MTSFIALLVFGQTILLTGVLLAAGLLSRTRDNAMQSFHQQITIRKNYLQAEIRNRWMSVAPFEGQISKLLPPLPADSSLADSSLADSSLSAHDYGPFFQNVTPLLIALMRSSLTSGAFIVLDAPHDNSPLSDTKHLPALYLRDYDPTLSNNRNSDLFLVLGPSDLSTHWQIPRDTAWHSDLPPLKSGENLPQPRPSRNFYSAPREQANSGVDPNLLGFWSEPFRVTPNDIPVITYSLPLVDQQGRTRGVLGVEVNIQYLSQFLEQAGGNNRHIKYALAIQKPANDSSTADAQPTIAASQLQLCAIAVSDNSNITPGQRIDLLASSIFPSAYSLDIDDSNYIVSVESLPFYTYTAPYPTEKWFFMGIEKEQSLMSFVHSLHKALIISFLVSLLLGITCGIWGSWRIIKPVTRLAKAVRIGGANPSTEATGLREIDDLAAALADAHQKRQESTVTMSRIIELVDEPIGAFELSSQSPHVMVTDQLGRILALNEVEAEEIFHNKARFIDMLETLLSRPEPEEKHVYKISEAPAKWVRMNIRTTENRTLGVVMDVSQEMHDKLKIRFDRDYDALTRLLNHASFQRQVREIIPLCHDKSAAIIMFDLDNLKPINDNYGHGWGDIYIKTAAQLLSAFRTGFSADAVSYNSGDPRVIVGRRSGDEFVVFLHSFDSREQIRALVSEFYAMLNAYTLAFPDGERKHISISGGLAWVDSPLVPYDELLQCADFTLYNAKRNFKGRFCVADEEDFMEEST